MTSQETKLHLQIEDNLQSQQTLKSPEMAVSDQAIPLDERVPNATTIAAMNETDELIQKNQNSFKSAEEMFKELEINI